MTSTHEQLILAGSADVRQFAAFLKDAAAAGKTYFGYSFPAETKSAYQYIHDVPLVPRRLIQYFAVVTGQREFRVLPPDTFTVADYEEMVADSEFVWYNEFKSDQHCLLFHLFTGVELESEL